MATDKNPIHHNTIHRENSLVITTIKERRTDLLELLHCLTHQIRKPSEVIVVSDGEILLPTKILNRYRELGIEFKIVKVSTWLTLGATRNVGLKKTKAKYICFLDDDALPTQRWFIEIEKSLKAGADIVGGVSKPLFKRGSKMPIWWDEVLMGPYVAVGNQYVKLKQDAIWGCNFAIKKDVIDKIGYFDESLGLRKHGPKLLGEDAEFVKRAVLKGLIVQLDPSAIVYHKLESNRINIPYFKKRALRYGRTWRELNKKHKPYTKLAFFREILFKTFRGLYFVLMHKTKVVTLPLYMVMLIYEVMGWSGMSHD